MLRRKKLGEALIDVSKYTLTVGVISSLLQERISIGVILGMACISVFSAVAGWFILPEEEEQR